MIQKLINTRENFTPKKLNLENKNYFVSVLKTTWQIPFLKKKKFKKKKKKKNIIGQTQYTYIHIHIYIYMQRGERQYIEYLNMQFNLCNL